MKKHKYSIIRVIFYRHIEKIHRFVFDVLYQQNYKIKPKDKFPLLYYKLLFTIAPDFRCYLKHWKHVLKRAYYQKRINLINLLIFHKLYKINYERYSSYF